MYIYVYNTIYMYFWGNAETYKCLSTGMVCGLREVRAATKPSCRCPPSWRAPFLLRVFLPFALLPLLFRASSHAAPWFPFSLSYPYPSCFSFPCGSSCSSFSCPSSLSCFHMTPELGGRNRGELTSFFQIYLIIIYITNIYIYYTSTSIIYIYIYYIHMYKVTGAISTCVKWSPPCHCCWTSVSLTTCSSFLYLCLCPSSSGLCFPQSRPDPSPQLETARS